ncbi:hypothetical protein [Algoriphagus sp. CAU 1675]|uniref:hypothetical protein n=1 Tax=Algoriphagus sp. CAU 1675 TaxID=3032597 RepID=UPI0023D9C6E1|nr:hypothetical protein [Algoriphagus sp. CAU 1675]MDF2158756.1 hypothetical protein [Algoriphagus sp. CAU 1675]
MKFPSIFRTSSPMRFDIKPRYYDPVKEEIEQRTARIKKELEAEGKLGERSEEESLANYESGLRGAFSKHNLGRSRDTSIFASTGMIRSFIFLFLVTAIGGYIYLGPVIFEYLLYLAMIGAAVYYFFKLKPKPKDE